MNLIVKHKEPIDGFTVYLKLFQLYKSFLLMISDHANMGIGNVTLGNPSTIEGMKPISTSYNVFGFKNNLLSTIISERASFVLKSPVLLLLFLKTKKNEEEILKPLTNFVNRALEKIPGNLEKC